MNRKGSGVSELWRAAARVLGRWDRADGLPRPGRGLTGAAPHSQLPGGRPFSRAVHWSGSIAFPCVTASQAIH